MHQTKFDRAVREASNPEHTPILALQVEMVRLLAGVARLSPLHDRLLDEISDAVRSFFLIFILLS